MAATDWDRDEGAGFLTVDDGGNNVIIVDREAEGFITLKNTVVDQLNVRVEMDFPSSIDDDFLRGIQVGVRVDHDSSPVPGAGIWVGLQNTGGGAGETLTIFSKTDAGVITAEKTGQPIDYGNVDRKLIVIMNGDFITAYIELSGVISENGALYDEISDYNQDFTAPVAGNRLVGIGRFADVDTRLFIDNFVAKNIT